MLSTAKQMQFIQIGSTARELSGMYGSNCNELKRMFIIRFHIILIIAQPVISNRHAMSARSSIPKHIQWLARRSGECGQGFCVFTQFSFHTAGNAWEIPNAAAHFTWSLGYLRVCVCVRSFVFM